MAGTLILFFFAGMFNYSYKKVSNLHHLNANYDFTGTGGEISQTEERGSHQGGRTQTRGPARAHVRAVVVARMAAAAGTVTAAA